MALHGVTSLKSYADFLVKDRSEVENLYREWQRTRPGATVRQFWLAVSAGEVDIPGCSVPLGD